MKIAVTGALGHIGSGFIHSLRPGEFDRVLLLDNFSTQRYCSLFKLPEGVPFRFIEADILSVDLPALLDGIDAVVHLAAITDAPSSFDNARAVEEVNFDGTIRVAEASKTVGSALLFPSTTSVYGSQKEVVDESCSEDELRPQSPYAEAKLRAERGIEEIGGKSDLRYILCRFGTIFGPSAGMRFHTAINKFIWQASQRIPITVWRTALDQKRPYLDLQDSVRAIKFILAGQHFHNDVYNVLTLNSTVREVVETIRSFVPDLEIELVDTEIMNQLSYAVKDEKFRGLGFQPTGKLRAAVEETLRLLGNLRG